MSFFEFPYTRTYSSDLGWIIRQLQWVTKEVQFKTIKYADPLAWDITRQYEQNTVVIDQNTGIAYLSTQPVPTGVSISNTDYWTVIFDLQRIIGNINNNLTVHNNGTSPTLSFDALKGDWILWNNGLYVALHDISAGSALIEGSNVDKASVEDLTKSFAQSLHDAIVLIIGSLSDLNTTDKTSIVNAINEVLSDVNTLALVVGDLNDLNTTDKSSIVNAINEVLTTITTQILNVMGDLNDLHTIDKSTIVNAINEVMDDITAALNNVIGDLDNLNTTDKTLIVNAINEVLSDVDALALVVGDLNDLATTDKSSIVNAINEVFNKVDTDIQQAIDDMQHDIETRTEDIFNIKSLNLDWTQDITAEVENALQSHKRLYFPEGNYRFSITLTDQDIEIWGDGWQRTYFHPVDGPCITLDARNGVNCGDEYLHDFAIVGTSRNYDGIRTYGNYDTDPINNCVFKNLFINDCASGINWNSRGIWCVFDHVWCYGNERGLYVHLDNDCAFNHNSFTDCLFGYNMKYGIYILGQANFKVNSNQFNHCTFERNWLQGHTTSDFSNVLIYNNATAFLDCYIEGEDGAADFYVRNGDITVRGGSSLVPHGTFIAIADATSYAFVFGLHGFNTSNYKITDSGSYNNHCYVIGSAISGYQMNGAYVQY